MKCNDTQHNTTKHNDAQHNSTKHNDTQHNAIKHNDTHHNDSQCLCWVSFILCEAIKSIMQSGFMLIVAILIVVAS